VGTVVFSGDEPAVLLLALVAVPVSIWVGHRTRRDRRWLWGVVPLNVLAGLVLLWPLSAGPSEAYDSGSVSSYPASMPGLWQDSEREIRDIRPVDANGNPLTGVYLFDQDGRPIDTSAGEECAAYDEYGATRGAPWSGAPYPRGTWDVDPRTGDCRLTPPGPLVVAVPTTPAPATGGMTAPPTVEATPEPTPGPDPAPPVVSVPPAPLTAPPTR
jgi:hypothetical protein